MRCAVIVWLESGLGCCGEPMAHIFESQPMCDRHLVMSLNRGYPFRPVDAGVEQEQRARSIFATVMDA